MVEGVARVIRVAESGIEGKARRGTPICPEALMEDAEDVFRTRQRTVKDASRCTVVVFGTSDLDVTERAVGEAFGTIGEQLYIVVNSALTNPIDAPELVVAQGSFNGTVVMEDASTIR